MEPGDRDNWTKLSLSNLERAYGDDEPEYPSTMLQLDFLENEAQLGSEEAFEDYLANVPNTPPTHGEDVAK